MISAQIAVLWRTRRLETLLICLACALLIIAPFRSRARVQDVSTGLSDPASMPMAVSTAPGLDVLPTLHPEVGPTLHAIDVISQTLPGSTPENLIHSGATSIAVSKAVPLSIAGWAIDGRARSAAIAVFIAVDGRAVASCPISIARPDVATVYGIAAYASSGFSCTVAAGRLVPGRHRLAIDTMTEHHTYYRSEITQELIIR